MSDEPEISVEIKQPEPEVVKIEPEKTEVVKIEPEKTEGDEWKILLGELKAKMEAQELKMRETESSLNLLKEIVDDLGSQMMLHRETEQAEWMALKQRLVALEEMAIIEEVTESTPEIEPQENAEESPVPERKRPKLIG